MKLVKIEPWNLTEDSLSECIKCYTSFFPQSKIFLTHRENNLILINKGVFYSTKKKVDFLYCIKTKETKSSKSFQVFNLSNKHLMDVNISVEEDIRFRYIFNRFFIFTDFQKQFKLTNFVKKGLYLLNYQVEFVKKENKQDRFNAKIYKKSEMQYKNLQEHLYKTLQKLMKLKECSNVMNFFNFYEDENNFYVISNLSFNVSLDEFLKINQKILDNGVMLNFLKNIINVFQYFEKLNIQIPFLSPDSIMITLFNFNKELFMIHKKIYLKLKEMLESKIYKNMTEEIQNNNNYQKTIDFKVDQDGEEGKKKKTSITRKFNNLFNTDKLTLGNHSDINNFVPIFTNTDFLFNVDKCQDFQDRKVNCGFKKIIFLSNLFTNVTKNLNCINLGLIYFYIISKTNFCIPIEQLSLEQNSEIYYINFPNNVVKNLSFLEKQTLYYFFTSKELKDVEKNLMLIVDFEEIVNEKYYQDQSIYISSSKDSSLRENSVSQQNQKNNELNVKNLEIKLSSINSPTHKMLKKSSNFFPIDDNFINFNKRKVTSSLIKIESNNELIKLRTLPFLNKDKISFEKNSKTQKENNENFSNPVITLNKQYDPSSITMIKNNSLNYNEINKNESEFCMSTIMSLNMKNLSPKFISHLNKKLN